MRELAGSAVDDVMAAGVVGQARAFAAAVRGGPVDVPGASASARATAIGRAVIEATRQCRRSGGGVMARRVVIHQDDVGMCHGANVAFLELSARGTVTSGSVMVPCPWFAEIAEWAAADAVARSRRPPHADGGEDVTTGGARSAVRRGRPV